MTSAAATKAVNRREAKDQGLPHFYPDVPCPRGHIGLWYTKGGCSECARQQRKLNPASDQACKERANLKRAIRVSKSIKERRRRRIERDHSPEKKERRRAQNIQWIEENPERRLEIARHSTSLRRARKLKAEGSHTPKQSAALFRLQGEKCANCRIKLTRKNRHLDHIHPLSKGGSNDVRNLQWLCVPCNCTKSAKDPLKWAAENGRLL